jgi:hypothetical protein
MTKINRRRFVASLTAATAFTGLAPSLSRSETATHVNEHPLIHRDDITFMDDSKNNKLKEWWCMIRRDEPHGISTAAEGPAVDFWSRQYSDINYVDHLPREIRKTSLFYESCDCKDFNNERAFGYLDTLPERYGIKTAPEETLNWSVNWHREYLSGSFRARAGNASPEELRTALIALDSTGPSPTEPEWAEYLRLLTRPYRSYRHIIGHIHAPGRGLRELRARLNCIEPDNEKSYFDRSVWDAASHCDVVIVTSSSLIESDLGLCPSSSTETLAGELVRRFGHALLDRAVLHEIVGSKDDHAKHQPRLFALASATVDASNWYCLQVVHEILNRQRRLVSGSFGELALDGTPIVVAITTRDRQLKEHAIYVDRKTFFEIRVPTYRSKHIGLAEGDNLILIALWPFNFDAEAESS